LDIRHTPLAKKYTRKEIEISDMVKVVGNIKVSYEDRKYN
jgi:hypothetical protein